MSLNRHSNHGALKAIAIFIFIICFGGMFLLTQSYQGEQISKEIATIEKTIGDQNLDSLIAYYDQEIERDTLKINRIKKYLGRNATWLKIKPRTRAREQKELSILKERYISNSQKRKNTLVLYKALRQNIRQNRRRFAYKVYKFFHTK